MRAAILSMGDELVLGQIQERNAKWLSEQLVEEGVTVVEHRTVADDLDATVEALAHLAPAFDLVITTGALGPTDDDLLRSALARVMGGRELVMDDDARREIEQWFAGRGRPMPEINLRQAMRPPGASCLSNSHGTAPGLSATLRHCRIWCLPGPPAEMKPMFERFVLPSLRAGRARPRMLIESIPVFGLGESAVAERLGPLMQRDRNPLVGTTASGMIVTVRLRASGDAANDRGAFDAIVSEVLERVAPYALGLGARTLPEALAADCIAGGERIALAESCTGGLASSMVCEVPGASSWYRGGVVTYSNELKMTLLGVSAEVLAAHGAVSGACAEAMARGALERLDATASASITGVAGPDGGSQEKPVGTVHIAIARRSGGMLEVAARRFAFPGDRAAVRDRAARTALGALRLHVRGHGGAPLLWERRN